MTTRRWWGAVLVAALAGCEAPAAAPAGCRVGPQPCDEGEVCVEGECVPAAEQDDGPPDPADFRVQIQPERGSLIADRTHPSNRMIVRVRIQNDAGEPFSGNVILRANPFGAASFEPILVEMKEGLGASRVRGCDGRDDACPDAFRVDVALDAYPTVVIGHGDPIRLDHGRPRPKPDAAPAPAPAPDAGM